ncbi:MAG: glycoside hydrolase family 92 protein, partial [Muribaculaceae bacterium]|nr:glycoside hydrolase family 92 protein [Muribaculaceae bacterium]
MNCKNLLQIGLAVVLGGCGMASKGTDEKSPADYVNPYIGNVSHLLVPTFPNVHLPNSMLRVVPERADYTADRINGLPVVVTNHREKSAFNLSPFQGEKNAMAPVIAYSYDNEDIRPYFYSVYLDEPEISVRFAPSHQSAVYEMTMNPDAPAYIIVNSKNGELTSEGNVVKGYQNL